MNARSSVPTGLFAGRFEIDRELGRGATAIVLLARDLEQDRMVALKVLRAELAETAAARHFIREIRRQGSLTHPHVVPILDTGEHDGRPYIVLPLMEGGSLRQLLEREKQLSLAEAMRITLAIAEALQHAHERGVIHRDVKPENILFANGEAHLADFGIARALESVMGESSTSTGIVRGTAAYMSPEQAAGERMYDGRSDIFSLGCVLYEMLAGVPAFVGPTPEAVLAQRFSHTPRDVTVYRATVPASVESIIARSLQIVPADRFRTAEELVAALRAAPTAEDLTRPMRDSERRAVASGNQSAIRTRVRVLAPIAIILAVGILYWSGILGGRQQHLQERDWILVADFDGPGDDPALATSVRELVTAALNQSTFLNTVPRSQLVATMRLAGIPDTTRVDTEKARELAERTAVRAVVNGSVRRVGTNYAVILRVVAAGNGADIWSKSAEATEDNLVRTVQDLARDMRQQLGEHPGTVAATQALEQVATPSFAAYRKYIEGMNLQARGDARGSNRALREAQALDSGFASAWYLMAWNYQNERIFDSARMAFRAAVARRARLSEVQRYRLDADVAYTIDYDVPAAVRAYDLFLSAMPSSYGAHNNHGNYLVALGRYDDALESYKRAVAAHPFGARQAQTQAMNEAATLVALGRIPDAQRAADSLTGWFASYIRFMIAGARDQWASVEHDARAASTSPSTPTWLRMQSTAVVASALASRGAIRAADEQLAAASAGAATPELRRWYYRARLLVALATGRTAPAPDTAMASDGSAAGLATIAYASALRGDTLAARRALARVAAAPPTDVRVLGNSPAFADALIAARANDWRAVTAIAPLAIAGEHDASALDRVGSLSMRWLAAEAYAHAERTDSAIAVLELAITPQRMPGSEFALRGLVTTFAHHRLAQWYSRIGKTDDARRHWRAFLTAMTEPDDELKAMISEARRASGSSAP